MNCLLDYWITGLLGCFTLIDIPILKLYEDGYEDIDNILVDLPYHDQRIFDNRPLVRPRIVMRPQNKDKRSVLVLSILWFSMFYRASVLLVFISCLQLLFYIGVH